VELQSPSPFCLPLLVERLREQLSTEQLTARIERWIAQACDADGAAQRPRTRPTRAGRASRSDRRSQLDSKP